MEKPTREHPLMYGLSTCGWCRKARTWLEGRFGEGGFDLIYVDLLSAEEKAKVMEELRKSTPSPAFPMIFADGECIIGYREDEYRRVFGS